MRSEQAELSKGVSCYCDNAKLVSGLERVIKHIPRVSAKNGARVVMEASKQAKLSDGPGIKCVCYPERMRVQLTCTENELKIQVMA